MYFFTMYCLDGSVDERPRHFARNMPAMTEGFSPVACSYNESCISSSLDSLAS